MPSLSFEKRLLYSTLLEKSLVTEGFKDWDGMLEIARCVAVDESGTVERLEPDDTDDAHWYGRPFWTVYLHQHIGGVRSVADVRTQEEANAFATALHVYNEHLQKTARGAATAMELYEQSLTAMGISYKRRFLTPDWYDKEGVARGATQKIVIEETNLGDRFIDTERTRSLMVEHYFDAYGAFVAIRVAT